MHTFGDALLGAWTFLASPHSADTCGINGLPLTPNSIRVLGRFQKLKQIIHPKLCTYLDIVRGRHERLMIVVEHYSDNLQSQLNLGVHFSENKIANISFNCLDALEFLHKLGIVHRCLSPSCILFTKQGNVKLANYGLYHMTEFGATVPFPIGLPKFMAPEVLSMDLKIREDLSSILSSPCGPKVDIWSLGMILLEITLKKDLWKEWPLNELFLKILQFRKLDSGSDVVKEILAIHEAELVWESLSSDYKIFIEECLHPCPAKRPSSKELLVHSFLINNQLELTQRESPISLVFPSVELQCTKFKIDKPTSPIKDHIAHCPMEVVYYLWQLAGGDVDAELRKQGLIKAKPSICAFTNLVLEGGEEFGEKKDKAFLMDDTVIILPLDLLKQRLKDIDPRTYYPTLEHSPLGPKSLFTYTEEAVKLPVVIREKDVEYQLNRAVLFSRLLMAYPFKKPQIVKEAKKDIPPLYRAKIWASILEVEGDVQMQYEDIDKETPTATDRQIEVDIPRCHQYNELMASPTGHTKFKRLLKAWIVSHPQYVYWQGLDSLCAPFLYLNFNDEALAYACLKAFIPKYLHNFFLKDNSPVIQEYLAVFSQLIAYHDPELTNHLDSIQFMPELYSIPWFLTMYTHVFPLHKIFHLWDTLLLGGGAFPLCIGVAILQQLRNSLLSFGFNECILLFSDMPEIDIERCVQDSMKIFSKTPKSTTYRQHEKQYNETNQKHDPASPLAITPISIETLKSEVAPRISGEELLDLINSQSGNKTSTDASKVKLQIVDVRPNEDFSRGCFPESLNIPFPSNPDVNINVSSLNIHKGKMIVVAGSARNNHSSTFATQLVRQGFPQVSILHNGVDVMRTTGILVVGTEA